MSFIKNANSHTQFQKLHIQGRILGQKNASHLFRNPHDNMFTLDKNPGSGGGGLVEQKHETLMSGHGAGNIANRASFDGQRAERPKYPRLERR